MALGRRALTRCALRARAYAILMWNAVRRREAIVLALAGAAIGCGIADQLGAASSLPTAASMLVAALSCLLLSDLVVERR